MKHTKLLALVLVLVALTSFLYVAILSCSSSKSPVKAPDDKSCEDGMRTVAVIEKDDPTSSAQSINTFSRFEHYTAEAQQWFPILNDTASYRDVMVAGRTYVSNPEDGETWSASVTLPDGTTKNWNGFTFHSVSGEDTNCFISYVPYWRLCDATSISIQWQIYSQCRETGTWHMSFFNNGQLFHEDSFVVIPQVDTAYLTQHDQNAYPDNVLHQLDSLCSVPGQPMSVDFCDNLYYTDTATIAGHGCKLVSFCMVLNYHGVPTNPELFNNWLKLKNFDFLDVTKLSEMTARYAQSLGYDVYFVSDGVGEDMLSDCICSFGPQVIFVKQPISQRFNHYVVATGQDINKTTYLIDDPSGGVSIKLSDKYEPDIHHVELFQGPEYQFKDDVSRLLINFRCPIEVCVTDPDRQKTGYDPQTGQTYTEIPNSSYYQDYIESADGLSWLECGVLNIGRPLDGDHDIDVTGIGDGTYNIDVCVFSSAAGELPSSWEGLDIPITNGEVHQFTLRFDKAPGSQAAISGAFEGGRHRPRDVDRFLSYVKPTQSVTNLPSGTTTYDIFIVYGETILPQMFKADLNGEDISDLFTPVSGGYEIVSIPVQSGQNIVALSIKGDADGRMMSDEDELTLMVQ